MKRAWVAAVSVVAALVLVPAAAGQTEPGSGVRGTVLDTTCETGCMPPLPLLRAPAACTRLAAGCPPPPTELPDFPPYEGEAATVLVRRAGSAKVLGRVSVAGGRFTAHLAPGRYVLRAHVAAPCWTGNRQVVEIEPDRWVPLVLRVADGCAVHPTG